MGDFIISFNKTIKLPNYAFYSLEGESELPCAKKRWKEDTALGTYKIDVLKKVFNYARGHLVHAKDVDDTCSTYIMSNIAPQIQTGFNNGLWKTLENYVRKTYEGFDVLTVPDYDFKNKICNSKNICLEFPVGFYKIIMNDNKVVCSLYLTHRKYEKGSKLNDHVVCGKLPYMIKTNMVGKCDETEKLVCKNYFF